jgi:hypothetical protein
MKAFAIQFLSRDFLSPRLLGGRSYQPLLLSNGEELNFSVELEYTKEPFKYTFAQPWPQQPSIGAMEYVDPYQEVRWPALVSLTASIDVTDSQALSMEFAHKTLGILRNVLWCSFQSISALRSATDQILSECGYRRAYITTTMDFNRNPVPSSGWHLEKAESKEPRGPGFICLDERIADNNCRCLVWSQAISFPNRTTLIQDQKEVKERIQKVRWHWNAYDEIRNADRYIDQRDIKGAVRSAASAVDASIRSYAGLYGKEHLLKSKLPFNDKIEEVLKDAGQDSYQAINPESSRSLLKLYRARNSMHTGDCCYTDPDTGKTETVDTSMAREFVIEAKNFFLWLSARA